MAMDQACDEKRARHVSCTALHWTPEGKLKWWRPMNTWCRTVEGELKTLHHTQGTVQNSQPKTDRSGVPLLPPPRPHMPASITGMSE